MEIRRAEVRKKLQDAYVTNLFTLYQLKDISYSMLPKLIEMSAEVNDDTLLSVLKYIQRNIHHSQEQPEAKKPKHDISELMAASKMTTMTFNEDLRNLIIKDKDLTFTIFWLVGEFSKLCKTSSKISLTTIQDCVNTLLVALSVSSVTMLDVFNVFIRQGCIKQSAMIARLSETFKENPKDDNIITALSGMTTKTTFKDFERFVVCKLPVIAALCTKTKSDANLWSSLLNNTEDPNLPRDIIYYLECRKVKMSTLCSILSIGKIKNENTQNKVEMDLSKQNITHENILYIATQVLDMAEFGNIDVNSFISFTGYQCYQHWDRIKAKKDQSDERGWLILYSLMNKDLSFEMFLGLIQVEEVRACKNYTKKIIN